MPVKITFFYNNKCNDFMFISAFYLILKLGYGLAKEGTAAKPLLPLLYEK